MPRRRPGMVVRMGLSEGTMAAVVAIPLGRLNDEGCNGGWLGLAIHHWQWRPPYPDLEVGTRCSCSGCLMVARVSCREKALHLCHRGSPLHAGVLCENPCPLWARQWRRLTRFLLLRVLSCSLGVMGACRGIVFRSSCVFFQQCNCVRLCCLVIPGICFVRGLAHYLVSFSHFS